GTSAARKRFLWEDCIAVLEENIPARVQSIDDCVSFAFAAALEYLQCVQLAREKTGAFSEISTEAIYGLSRQDIAPRLGANQPGTNGYRAARALREIGALERGRYGPFNVINYD